VRLDGEGPGHGEPGRVLGAGRLGAGEGLERLRRVAPLRREVQLGEPEPALGLEPAQGRAPLAPGLHAAGGRAVTPGQRAPLRVEGPGQRVLRPGLVLLRRARPDLALPGQGHALEREVVELAGGLGDLAA
jgi:hypothetical protein